MAEQPELSASPACRSPKSERLLLLLWILSLPFLNPWVRGDGVGYYAFARAPLIEHNLDFTEDYRHANESFRGQRIDENGQPRSLFRTRTGHLENHFTVGPAILWAPLLLVTHVGVLLARALGSSVAADGFSTPYRVSMALATAFYGFLGLLLALRLARQYVEELWALLATLAIWWSSSLLVYMYFNPSWSHTHSSFAVALFLWYWHKTLSKRSLSQWVILALITGLMLNVYYPNAMVLAVLAIEAARQYYLAFRPKAAEASTKAGLPFFPTPRIPELLLRHSLFAIVLLICLLPTLITRYIIYGSPFESGYIPLGSWLWSSPVFFSVLFSSNHGLITWTPILIFSIAGLFIFWRWQRRVGTPFLAAFLTFYLFISCYPDWAGISSYGNRFFVSLTPVFILGLAVFFDRTAQLFDSRRAALAAACALLAVFTLWNGGLMFQWGLHLIPARGPVSCSEIVHNQFFVVPRQLSADLQRYFFKRKALMQQIENRDVQQLKTNPAPP
ncbi:MAG TPA: glycosyltransferase family 39 protein [Candidatus Acidoferrum sp.]|nr:glycosyltransferase family 39 protein [Candidatus Acidoferrum sp.]